MNTRIPDPFGDIYLVPRRRMLPDGDVIPSLLAKARIERLDPHTLRRLAREHGVPGNDADLLRRFDELLRRGDLVAVRQLHRRSVLQFEMPDVLGPLSEADDTLGPSNKVPSLGGGHWVIVKLVDKKTGAPLPRRPYSVITQGGFGAENDLLGKDGTARVDEVGAMKVEIACPSFPAVDEQDVIVHQGEHASGIAERFGYENVHDVWDHPSNAKLAKIRKPHVLLPGDVLHIPARAAAVPEKDKAVDQTHVFTLERSPLKLVIELKDAFKHPLAGVVATFEDQSQAANENGLLEMDIEKSARGGTLVLPSKHVALRLGHLDPIEEDSGWRARLVNMGYMFDDEGGAEEDHIALEDFQADYKLTVTGKLDDKTRAKILAAHGC